MEKCVGKAEGARQHRVEAAHGRVRLSRAAGLEEESGEGVSLPGQNSGRYATASQSHLSDYVCEAVESLCCRKSGRNGNSASSGSDVGASAKMAEVTRAKIKKRLSIFLFQIISSSC